MNLDLVENQVHASQILILMRDVEAEIEQIEATRDEHVEWFNGRIASKKKTIDFMKGKLAEFMEKEGGKTISLPSGTLKVRTKRNVTWPEDDDLVKWSAECGIPTRMANKPDKKAINEFMKETGTYPPGYNLERSFEFYVTTRNGDD